MEHRTMRSIAAAEVMPLHKARKPAALADADHIHLLIRLELLGENAIARLEVVVSLPQAQLLQKLGAFGARLLQMSRLGFV